MQSDKKVRSLRVLGGLVAALAVVPWLGVGTAQAAGGGDDNCATRPAGVSGDATCSLLLGPNGTKVFGEAWAVRTSDNHLVVWAFPDVTPGNSDAVQLCATSTGAYPAKHQCTAFDPDNVFGGSSTTIDVNLGSHGITAGDPAWWALSVQQGSSTAVTRGGAGAIPTPTPTTTATDTPTATASDTTTATTSPSTSPSHTHSHSPSPTPTDTTTESPSPSISDTTTSTTSPSESPSASVLPTKITNSPSTSVLGTKLAHTGGGGVGSALVLSVALLGLGGLLVVGAQTAPAGTRRRH